MVDRTGRIGWIGFASALLVVCAGCGSALVPSLVDSDRDGLADAVEQSLGTDPQRFDTDLDGLSDGTELASGTSPLAFDSDHDGIGDGDDVSLDEPSRRLGSISSGNDVEPNDVFARAVVTGNVGAPRRVFEGRIDRVSDVDVFELGPLEAGSLVVVDFEHRDRSLRPVVALFDGAADVVDRTAYPYVDAGYDMPSIIDQTIRHHGEHYRLAVTTRGGSPATGAYRLSVTIEDAGAVPLPRGQIVLLDFNGGTLDEPILDQTIIDPFSAAAIDEAYAGQDDALKAAIAEVVRARFHDLNVVVLTSDDPPADLTGVSTLFVGSFHRTAFGAADAVDPFNEDPCDNGIVFAESFSPIKFGFTPPLEDLAVAIGQVAAHEIGHLLGLRHVLDPTAIMDEVSPASTLLADQAFKRAILAESVFPIGYQDAPALLLDTVGFD